MIFRELQRRSINAVALAGGRRPVVEDVPQMTAASRTKRLFAMHPEAIVLFNPDVERRNLVPKPRPAGARFKLISVTKQIGPASHALINSLARLWNRTLFAERTLGPLASHDLDLLRRQDLFPFVFCLHDGGHFFSLPHRGVVNLYLIVFVHRGPQQKRHQKNQRPFQTASTPRKFLTNMPTA